MTEYTDTLLTGDWTGSRLMPHSPINLDSLLVNPSPLIDAITFHLIEPISNLVNQNRLFYSRAVQLNAAVTVVLFIGPPLTVSSNRESDREIAKTDKPYTSIE